MNGSLKRMAVTVGACLVLAAALDGFGSPRLVYSRPDGYDWRTGTARDRSTFYMGDGVSARVIFHDGVLTTIHWFKNGSSLTSPGDIHFTEQKYKAKLLRMIEGQAEEPLVAPAVPVPVTVVQPTVVVAAPPPPPPSPEELALARAQTERAAAERRLAAMKSREERLAREVAHGTLEPVERFVWKYADEHRARIVQLVRDGACEKAARFCDTVARFAADYRDEIRDIAKWEVAGGISEKMKARAAFLLNDDVYRLAVTVDGRESTVGEVLRRALPASSAPPSAPSEPSGTVLPKPKFSREGVRRLAVFSCVSVLRVTAPPDRACYFKLIKKSTGEPYLDMVVPAGETREALTPSGTFVGRYQLGLEWRNYTTFFGTGTALNDYGEDLVFTARKGRAVNFAKSTGGESDL